MPLDCLRNMDINQKPRYSIGSVVKTPLGEGIVKMHFSNLNQNLPDRWNYTVYIGYGLETIEFFGENQLDRISHNKKS
jgi:hypothetical protein